MNVYPYKCVCVCVCVCVRACVRACVRSCVRAFVRVCVRAFVRARASRAGCVHVIGERVCVRAWGVFACLRGCV